MNPRWHVIRAVFKRNFVSYFINPIGYLFITFFVGACAYFAFWHNNVFFANNLADLDPLNAYFPYLLLFFVPAITMSVWAEERRSGTEELLLTLPASDFEIVLGKYLGCLAIYTVALLFSLSNVLVLRYLGAPDRGLMLSTYLGYWLLGAALLSAGMTASLLSANVTVAFILGAAVCFLLVGPQWLFGGDTNSFFGKIVSEIGVVPHFEPFGKGLVSLRDIFYFFAIIAVMLYLNMVLLSRRHWSGSEQAPLRWFHYLTRAVCLLIGAVALTIVANRAQATLYVDATEERIHDLSPDTLKILSELDPKRPVFIEAFISPEVPKEYVETRRNLVDLLTRYDAMGKGVVEVKIHETEPFSETARDAERVYEIRPEKVTSMENNRFGAEDIFLGVAFKSGLNEKTIPFFYPGLPIEYELTRMIRTVSEKAKRKIGVLTTDAGLFGQFNFQMMQPPRDWLIVNELKQQYEVVQISPDSVIVDAIDVLIVPMASSLTQTQLNNVIEYLKQGKPTLILDDPMPFVNPRLAALEQKQAPQQNPMFGQQPPSIPKGNLRDLTNALNIQFNAGNIVWQDWNPHPQYRDLPPEYVFVGQGNEGFNQKNSITSGLQEVIGIYPGSISPRGSDGPEFTPLLSTNERTGTTPWNNVFEQSFLGRMMNPTPRRRVTGTEYVLAAYIHGPFEASAAKGDDAAKKEESDSAQANVIFVADLDMISDAFFELRRQGAEDLRFDNVTFVLNCVDFLAGDDSFVELRKKRPKRRTLDRIAKMTENENIEARKSEEQAEATAQAQLDKAQKGLDEAVQKIRERTDIDERTKRVMIENERRTAQRALDVQKQEIENKKRETIRDIQTDLQVSIRDEQTKIKWLAVLLPPIPALLIGLAVFFGRVSGEKEGVDPRRMI